LKPFDYLVNLLLCHAAIEATNKQIITIRNSFCGLPSIKWFTKAYPKPAELKKINTKLNIFSLTEVDVVFIIVLIDLIILIVLIVLIDD